MADATTKGTEMDTTTEIFGDPIYTYTRAQALEDGDQVDVSYEKGAAVYSTAVFVTSALWAEIVRGQGSDAETRDARLWDVCWMVSRGRVLSQSARESRVKVGRRVLTVRAECGPVDIDDPRPAITLGFPEDF